MRLFLHFNGLLQRHARQADDLRSKRPFLQQRDELAPDEGYQRQADKHHGDRADQDHLAMPKRPFQHGQIPLLHPPREACLT